MSTKFLAQILWVWIAVVLVLSGNALAATKKAKKEVESSTADKSAKADKVKPTVLRTVQESKYGLEFEIDADNLGSILSVMSVCKQHADCNYDFNNGSFQRELSFISNFMEAKTCSNKSTAIDRQECLEGSIGKDSQKKILMYINSPVKVIPSSLIKFKTTSIAFDVRDQVEIANKPMDELDDNFPSSFKESWIKELVSVTGYDFRHERFKVLFSPSFDINSEHIAKSKVMRLKEAMKNGPIEARVTGVLKLKDKLMYGSRDYRNKFGFDSHLTLFVYVKPKKVEFYAKDSETPIVVVEYAK